MILPNQVIPQCESTNKILKDGLLLKKYKTGDWIRAERQTGGRGRQGRVWISPEGGFYFSHLFIHNNFSQMTLMPLFIGMTLLNVLCHLFPELKLKLKWPNDIFLNGKKCGGILCESLVFEGERYIIVGIGLNINQVPEDVINLAACLPLNEKFREAHLLCQKIQDLYLLDFEKAYPFEILKNPSSFKNKFNEVSFLALGEQIVFIRNNESVNACWAGIAEDGSAIVIHNNGKSEKLYSEEIQLKILS